MIKIRLDKKQIQMGSAVMVGTIMLKYVGQAVKDIAVIISIGIMIIYIIHNIINKKYNNAILLTSISIPLLIGTIGVLKRNMFAVFTGCIIFFIVALIISIKGIKYDNTKS